MSGDGVEAFDHCFEESTTDRVSGAFLPSGKKGEEGREGVGEGRQGLKLARV